MAWYSYTLAFALRAEDAERISDSNALQGAWTKDAPFVHTASRNGVLLATLKAISEQWPSLSDIYLLRHFALLDQSELEIVLKKLESLIASIGMQPERVVEATKQPYTPQVFLLSKEYKPQPAEIVYPSDANIKSGYVLQYTEEEVRRLLNGAVASDDPRPSHDDDGETLEYVFNFLQSHLQLLRIAIDSRLVVVYGEMN